MNIDITEIQKRVDAGLIKAVRHPTLDLTLYNYTKRTQYDIRWDRYTKLCRGLILNNENKIVARPFQKFFNIGETEETKLENLPPESPVITEKLDGIMGILYPENDKLAIATRGAFESEHTVWATDWIRKKGYTIDDFKPNYTYCFEIVYPNSRIVVDYGNRSELVLLAVLGNEGQAELNHIGEAHELGFGYAREYSFPELNEALAWLNDFKGSEREGLVCKYSNGLRIKLKSDDYKRLHKVLTGLTTKDIWESLKNNKSIDDILELTPDEFYDWVRSNKDRLVSQKNHIVSHAEEVVRTARTFLTRKEQAVYIKGHADGITGVCFALLDGRQDKAEQSAWSILKPSGNNQTWDVAKGGEQ